MDHIAATTALLALIRNRRLRSLERLLALAMQRLRLGEAVGGLAAGSLGSLDLIVQFYALRFELGRKLGHLGEFALGLAHARAQCRDVAAGVLAARLPARVLDLDGVEPLGADVCIALDA